MLILIVTFWIVIVCTCYYLIYSAPRSDIFPSSGNYNFVNGDGSTTVLSFDNQGPSNYEVQQNTTETNGTTFQSTTRVTPPGNVRTTSQIRGRNYNIAFLSGGERTQLLRDGEPLLTLNGIQRVDVDDDQELVYRNGIISFSSGGPAISNSVDRLLFYDGFRFYEFNEDKINSLPGPGTLYIDLLSGTALYSTERNLNTRLNQVISSLSTVNPTNPPESLASTQVLVTIAPISITVSTPSTSEPVSELQTSPESSTSVPITNEPLSTEEVTNEPQPSTESSKTRPESSITRPESSKIVCTESKSGKSDRSKTGTRRRKTNSFSEKESKNDEKSQVNCNPVESSKSKKSPRKSYSKCTRSMTHRHHHPYGHHHHHGHHHHCNHHHHHRHHHHDDTHDHTHHNHTHHRDHHTHDTVSRHTTSTKTSKHTRSTNTLRDKSAIRNKREAILDILRSTNDRKARQGMGMSFPLDLDSLTLNFELTLVDGRIFLSHDGQRFIDVTNPTKMEITDSMLISFKDSTLIVTDEATAEIITRYDNIEQLAIFNGTDVFQISEPYGPDKASNGQLYVSGKQAFFSNNKQFNELLEEQLKRVVPDKAQVMLVFQVLPNGDQLLLVDGNPVLQLNGAEVQDIPDRDFLQYANNTIFVQDFTEGMLDRSFPGITQVFVLNGIRPGLEVYMEVVTNEIPGGGRLYVHEPTGRALYSRDSRINDAITEHINSLSQPPPSIVFSIRFEPGQNRIPDVVILANGEEVVRLMPGIVEDHSLSPTQHLVYRNDSVLILMGDVILGAVDDIDELIFFDGMRIIRYEGSVPEIIVGGGQIFVNGNKGFYSVNSELNDRIGEALRAAEELAPATLPPTVTTMAPSTRTSSESEQSTNEASTEPEENISPTTEEPEVTSSKSRRTRPSTKLPEMTVQPKQSTTMSSRTHKTTTRSSRANQTASRSPRTHQTASRSPRTHQTASRSPRTKPSSKPFPSTKHHGQEYERKVEEHPVCVNNKSCCNRISPRQNDSTHHHHHQRHHHHGVKPVISRNHSSTSHPTRKDSRGRREKRTISYE